MSVKTIFFLLGLFLCSSLFATERSYDWSKVNCSIGNKALGLEAIKLHLSGLNLRKKSRCLKRSSFPHFGVIHDPPMDGPSPKIKKFLSKKAQIKVLKISEKKGLRVVSVSYQIQDQGKFFKRSLEFMKDNDKQIGGNSPCAEMIVDASDVYLYQACAP